MRASEKDPSRHLDEESSTPLSKYVSTGTSIIAEKITKVIDVLRETLWGLLRVTTAS